MNDRRSVPTPKPRPSSARRAPPIARAAVCALAAPVAAAPAAASPALVQPTLSVSSDYQSNPAFRVEDAESARQASVGLAVPVAWEAGRWQLGLDSRAQFRRSNGANSTDNRDYALAASTARLGERLTLSANAGVSQVNLRSVDAPEVGLERADGSQRASRAALTARWLVGERDSLSAAVDFTRTRYATVGPSSLADSDDLAASVTYAHALSPRVSLLVAAARSELDTEAQAGRTLANSAQAGFQYQWNELWSGSVLYGRSRVEREGPGPAIAGTVYQVALNRQTEVGAVALSAAQNFRSSAFGSVVRSRTLDASWSVPLSARLAASLKVARDETTEAFAGFDIQQRRSESAGATLAFALTETWSLGANANWSRNSYPATVLRARVPSAESWTAALSASRRFGSFALFEVLR